MSNVRKTKEGLIEKSTGRKIVSPLDLTHAKAIAQVEEILKAHNIIIVSIGDVAVNSFDDEMIVGEATVTTGKYVMAEFKVLVEV